MRRWNVKMVLITPALWSFLPQLARASDLIFDPYYVRSLLIYNFVFYIVIPAIFSAVIIVIGVGRTKLSSKQFAWMKFFCALQISASLGLVLYRLSPGRDKEFLSFLFIGNGFVENPIISTFFVMTTLLPVALVCQQYFLRKHHLTKRRA